MVSLDFRGKEISREIVRKVWQKHFFSKPMPSIRAFNVSPKEFFRIIRKAETSPEVRARTYTMMMEEYRRIVPIPRRSGFVAPTSEDKKEWNIWRRNNTRLSVEHVLYHEMRHIFRRI